MSDAPACPECGAPVPSGGQCRDYFDACLFAEADPAYQVVHHLLVATYMLQHPSQLSRAGWLGTRDVLVDFLIKGKSPADVRKQNRKRLASGNRTWRLKGGEPMAGLDAGTWSQTIADVRLDNAASYCADVERWARAALSDVEKAGLPLSG